MEAINAIIEIISAKKSIGFIFFTPSQFGFAYRDEFVTLKEIVTSCRIFALWKEVNSNVMDIQNKSKSFLQLAHKQILTQDYPQINTLDFIQKNNFNENETLQITNYLTGHSYINPMNGVGCLFPFGFSITSAGLDWMNDYTPQAQTVQNFKFDIKDNHGAVGINSDFSINNSFNFEKLDELIKANTEKESIDRAELEELKNQLKTITDYQIPISKGYLSKFSSAMQKHSWLSGQVAGFLIRWSTGL